MKNFIEEFKKFIMRGNVMDLAVGVIIGGAFQAIINSLVNDVIMPLIGLITGGLDFSNLFIQFSGEKYATLAEAQAAGVAALKETAYGEALRRLIFTQRPLLIQGLKDCGCQVIPGEANYLLFYCPDAMLGEKMKKNGVMIRDCSNYHGLEPGWFRVAVRTEEENRQLIQVLKEVTGK